MSHAGGQCCSPTKISFLPWEPIVADDPSGGTLGAGTGAVIPGVRAHQQPRTPTCTIGSAIHGITSPVRSLRPKWFSSVRVERAKYYPGLSPRRDRGAVDVVQRAAHLDAELRT